jgi:hypothetical protein
MRVFSSSTIARWCLSAASRQVSDPPSTMLSFYGTALSHNCRDKGVIHADESHRKFTAAE